eukprot:scaffold18003_cov146-Isochrysis_galbana.AAC.2
MRYESVSVAMRLRLIVFVCLCVRACVRFCACGVVLAQCVGVWCFVLRLASLLAARGRRGRPRAPGARGCKRRPAAFTRGRVVNTLLGPDIVAQGRACAHTA